MADNRPLNGQSVIHKSLRQKPRDCRKFPIAVMCGEPLLSLSLCCIPPTSTTTRLGFLLWWGSALVVSSHGAPATRARGGGVARLPITHKCEGLGHAQVRAGPHARQQHQDLGQGPRRGCFLPAPAAELGSDAPTTSGSCGDARPATCALHSDPCPTPPGPLRWPFLRASAPPRRGRG
jgi:hypothetical protein